VTGEVNMTLAEKFKSIEPAKTGLPCGVAKLMESMNKSDKEVLNSVLFEEISAIGKRISNTKIHQILTEEGYDVAVSSIAQHRRHQCRCFAGVGVRKKESK